MVILKKNELGLRQLCDGPKRGNLFKLLLKIFVLSNKEALKDYVNPIRKKDEYLF